MAEGTLNFDELAEHTRWIERLARSLVHDPDLAADVAQDAWVVALQRAPEDRPLGPWLVRVVRNLAFEHRRSEGMRYRIEKKADIGPRETTTSIEKLEAHRRVVEAVLTLPDPGRRVLVARYFHERTSSAIAAEHGVSEGTVRSWLSRSRARLRESLGDDGRSWAMVMAPLLSGKSTVTAAASIGWAEILKIACGMAVLAGLGWAVWSPKGEANRTSLPAPQSAHAGTDGGSEIARDPDEPQETIPQGQPPVRGAVGFHEESARSAVPSLRFFGRIVDESGKPLEGATVKVKLSLDPSESDRRVIADEEKDVVVESGADGTFECGLQYTHGLRVQAEVSLAGYVTAGSRMKYVSDRTDVNVPDLMLRQGGGCRATLVDAETGVRLYGSVSASNANSASVVDGLVDYSDLLPGIANLSFSSPGYMSVDRTVLITAGETVEMGEVRLLAVTSSRRTDRKTLELRFDHALGRVDIDPKCVTLTGGGGVFQMPSDRTFRDLIPGAEYTLEVREPSYLPHRKAIVVDRVRRSVRLKGASSLALDLVDAITGEPIEDAWIRVRRPSLKRSNTETRLILRRFGDSKSVRGPFGDLVPGEFELVVEAEGYSERILPFCIGVREQRFIRVEMDCGVNVSGQVLLGDGSKAEDVEVWLYPGDGVPERPSFYVGMPLAATFSGGRFDAPIRSGRTDSDGRFHFGGLEAGSYVVRARVSAVIAAWDRVEASPDSKPMEITLPTQHYLELQIGVAEGFPANVMGVVAAPTNHIRELLSPPLMIAQEEEAFATPVPGDGVVRLGPFPPGPVKYTVGLAETRVVLHKGRTRRGTLGRQQPPEEVVLGDGDVTRRSVDMGENYPGALRIRVFIDGAPASGFVVGDPWGQLATSDEEGMVRFPVMFPGKHELVVHSVKEGWTHPAKEVVIHSAQETHVELSLTTHEEEVVVVGADNEVAPFIRLPFSPLPRTGFAPVVFASDAEGRVVVRLPEGTHAISDRVDAALQLVWPPEGPAPHRIQIER